MSVPQGGIIELVALPSDPYICFSPVVRAGTDIYILRKPHPKQACTPSYLPFPGCRMAHFGFPTPACSCKSRPANVHSKVTALCNILAHPPPP